MNALTKAITKQYQRQQELITERDNNLNLLLSNLRDKIHGAMYRHLHDSIHSYFQPRIDDTVKIIQILEGVRDATD